MTPDGWHSVHLSDVADQRMEKVVPAKTDSRPYIALEHLAQGTPVLLGWSAAGTATSAKTLFRSGDVLFGKLRPYLRKAAPAPFGGLCSTDILPLFGGRSLDGRYLAQLAQWHPFRQHAVATSSGTKMPRTNWKQLGKFTFPLPPLPEQRKIAAILSSADDAIAKTQAVIDQVQVVKRGLMQELLTRGMPGRHMRFKQTEMGEIPEGWKIVRIIDVADVDYGISAAVSANSDPDIGWPILTGANLALDGQIDLSKLVYHKPPSKERFHLRKNDLLLNWRSGSPKHVGKTALFELDGNYTYASFVLRIRSRGKLVPGFGHVLLNFMRNAEFFSKDLSQQVNFKMNAAVFREVLIRLPSADEQEEIALTAARIDSRLAGEAHLLTGLQNVRSALMSVLLTGELRVTPDTEAA